MNTALSDLVQSSFYNLNGRFSQHIRGQMARCWCYVLDTIVLKNCFKFSTDKTQTIIWDNHLGDSKLCKERPQLFNHCTWDTTGSIDSLYPFKNGHQSKQVSFSLAQGRHNRDEDEPMDGSAMTREGQQQQSTPCYCWHSEQCWTVLSISLILPGHLTYILARPFIQVQPGWPLWSSVSTASWQVVGTMTWDLHNKHPSWIESSVFL